MEIVESTSTTELRLGERRLFTSISNYRVTQTLTLPVWRDFSAIGRQSDKQNTEQERVPFWAGDSGGSRDPTAAQDAPSYNALQYISKARASVRMDAAGANSAAGGPERKAYTTTAVWATHTTTTVLYAAENENRTVKMSTGST